MEKTQLLHLPLFQGVDSNWLEELFSALCAVETSYGSDCMLFHPGDTTTRFGILLEGCLKIRKEDYGGNELLITQIRPLDLFAEAFAWSGERLTVTVQTVAPSRVLWLDSREFANPRQDLPALRQVQQNLLRLFARKNLFLTRRIEHLSKRTLREKLLSYLSEQALQRGSFEFSIPLNRQELADFLAADRSALSAVLSGLQREGILRYHKNHFQLSQYHTQSFLDCPANLDG